MSENHESKAPYLQNGENGDGDDANHVRPEDESNPESGVNQEAGGSLNDMHHVESKEDMFVDAPDDMQENQFQEFDNSAQNDDVASPSSLVDLHALRATLQQVAAEKESIATQYKEERESLARQVSMLHHQLKGLTDEQLLPGDNGNDDVGQEVVVADSSLVEMICECSLFAKAALEERSRSESLIGELRQQIEYVNGNVEVVADRMLASLGVVINPGELVDYSVVGKIGHVERATSLLVEHYSWFLYEVDQLRQCLFEEGCNLAAQEESGPASVFAAARGGLIELRKKEVEMMDKLGHLEEENRKLVEQIEKEKAMTEIVNAEIEKIKVELEQEKTRCANTKERLSMAVTKGKALVQQRDSLKQALAEKTSDLEKCLAELQEKSSAIEAAELCKGELAKCENQVSSLQEMLSQKNATLESIETIFSEASVPEELRAMHIIERLNWLVNTVPSLQELLSQKSAILEKFEAIFSQASVPEDLKSADIIERLKWLVIFVSSLQETLSQRDRSLEIFNEILSQINIPEEFESMDTVETLKWFVEERNALKANLLEFHKLKDALSLIDLPETASSSDLETRIGWLRESVNQAKGEINMLQDEIARTKEVAHNEIDRLSASLSAELQEKEYTKKELDDLMHEYEGIVEKAHQASSEKGQMVKMLLEGAGVTVDSLEGAHDNYSDLDVLIRRCIGKIKEQSSVSCNTTTDAEVFERIQSLLYVRDLELKLGEKLLEEDMLVRSEVNDLSNELRVASLELVALKDEKDSLLKDLERLEEKSTLLREKLSLAVKKGKGLVQDRENLKILLDEKNSEIEKLKLELQLQESTVSECRNEINRLSTDLEHIPKLEADLFAMKDQRNQFEQFLLESNNMLQRIVESVDHISLPDDLVFEGPAEKVSWLAVYMHECQQTKTHAEQELGKAREESNTLATKLAEVQQTMKSLEDALLVAENHISQQAEEKMEMEVAKKNIEQDLQKAIDETNAQTSKFAEACAGRKLLEDALSLTENNIFLLTKEKEDAQLSRAATEAELEKVREEVAIQTSKLTEAYETVKSLEDALSQAEAKFSFLTEQNNLVQVDRTNLDMELKKLNDEAQSLASKLADASTTIKSLEGALAKAENDVSVLEDENKIAKQEISMLNSKLSACMDELAGTNGSLESRSVELMHHLSELQMLIKNENLLLMIKQYSEKPYENLKNMDLILKDIRGHFVDAGLEMLRTHLVMEEDSHAKKPFPFDLGNIVTVEMINGELDAADANNISLYFKKTVEGFLLRNKILADNFKGLSIFMDEFIEALLQKLMATKDAVMIIFEHIESMKQNVKNTDMQKEEQEQIIATLEKDYRVLLSACINATSELQFEVKNNLLELSSVPELEKLNHSLMSEVREISVDDTQHQQRLVDGESVNIAEKLVLAARKVQTLTKLFESTSNVAAATIEDLQNKLRETRTSSERVIEEKGLIQDRVSELETDIETLQSSFEELRLKLGNYHAIEEKLKEKEAEVSSMQGYLLKKEQENGLIRYRVSELETDVETLQSSCEESRLKLENYQAMEEKVKEKEAEVSTLQGNLLKNEQEAEDPLISASQLKTLFDKIHRVEICFTESEVGDMEPHSSFDVKKLFYIVDSVNELYHQVNVLSHEKDSLQSTLSAHILEIEHLKREIGEHIRDKQDYEKIKHEMSELMLGLEKVIDKLEGNAIVGDQKSASVQTLLPALEKQIMALLLETENSKSEAQELSIKLLESQKVIDELSNKVKLFEDSLQSRTTQPEVVQERSIFEEPTLPTGSEISEIEDVGSVGKNGISPIPSAAHVRTMRKGSTDHLALNIDLESASLINNKETDEDKGHVFKSLNTSGLIPKQGKSIADRIDGIWVSGGRGLMSRPRARLGLIAYWLFLHLWLLGTILL